MKSMEFTTQCDLEIGSCSGKISILWVVDPEIRQWGIKDMNVSVPDQEAQITYVDPQENEVDTTVKIVDARVEVSPRDGFVICPRDVEINMDDPEHPKVIVSF